MVQMLLQERADPMHVNATGETPFHIAVRSCHYEIAKELLDFIAARWDRYDAVGIVNMANQVISWGNFYTVLSLSISFFKMSS